MHRNSLPGASQGNSALRPGAVLRRNHRDVDPRQEDDQYRGDSGASERRRVRRRGGKKKWILAPIAAVAAVLAGGIAIAGTGNGTGGGRIQFGVVAAVSVQALGVDVSNAAVGQTVTAGAKVVAESETILSEAAIAVLGPDGKRVDFPHVRDWKVGTSQQVFQQSRAFDLVGTYRYWFTYKKDGRWVGHYPKRTFTVGGPSSPAPGTPSPATKPSPSGAGSTPPPAPTQGGSTSPGSGSQRGCVSNPAGCGYPSTANTGVPTGGAALAVINGNYTITTSGAVVDGKEIRGCVDVRAANVTIRNSRVVGQCFYGISTYSAGGKTTIERVEVNCVTGHGTGIAGPNFAVRAAYIHDCENGLEINSSSSVVDSVISAREGTSDAHGDGIQSQGGTNVVIRHNTLLEVNPVTSAIITNPTLNNGWLVEDNFMGGGAYTFYCPEQGTNFVVRNNRFVPAKSGLYSAAYGLTDACNHQGIEWTGNYRDTDGAAVAP